MRHEDAYGDEILRQFQFYLTQHRHVTFHYACTPDESPLAWFFWDQIRIRLEVQAGQLILGEVALPLPPWAGRLQEKMNRLWPYRSVSGQDCLELLDRVLAECDDQADNPLEVELGEGD